MMFKNRRKKKFYQRLMNKIDEGTWNMELRILTIKEIREGIRRQLDIVAGEAKGIDDEITRLKGEKKIDMDKVKKLTEARSGYDSDINKMQEQMIGKWSEGEQIYIGGIDQEVKSVEEKIAGGEEFKRLIGEQIKKI